jgi:hypothetical protein
VEVEQALDRLDRTLHTRAITARRSQKDALDHGCIVAPSVPDNDFAFKTYVGPPLVRPMSKQWCKEGGKKKK